jgi:hypothetical protein
MRFPFVASRVAGGVDLWLRAPADGPIAIQQRAATGWQTVLRLTGVRGAVAQAALPRQSGPATLRAISDGLTSLTDEVR